MSDYGRIAHEAYEEAAAQSGWETNPVSRVPWEHEVVPNPLTELAILEAKQRHPSRRGLR